MDEPAAAAGSGHTHSEEQLRYVRRRYLTQEAAGRVAVEIANDTFAARQESLAQFSQGRFATGHGREHHLPDRVIGSPRLGCLSSFGDAPVLFVDDSGSKSGLRQTSAMMYLADNGDPGRGVRVCLGGRRRHQSAWFTNISLTQQG